jgi:dihydroxyacetone kinase
VLRTRSSLYRNYTGDVLNFGLAREQYAALHPDKSNKLRFVIVADDVAVGKAQGQVVGRRSPPTLMSLWLLKVEIISGVWLASFLSTK